MEFSLGKQLLVIILLIFGNGIFSLLEMAKQRLVKVKQQETFGEIVIGLGEEAGEKKAHDQ